MAGNEFEIIQRFFKPKLIADDVVIGIGDDAAVLNPHAGNQLVWTVDTLVSGVHFFPDDPPDAIAHKALAVNLSDLAAMGARPAWFTLALTLPEADDTWLQGFSQGLTTLAGANSIALVGGDTTRGPCSITINAAGWLPAGSAITRGGAAAGDMVFLSGQVGDAALALAEIEAGRDPESHCLERLRKPTPRVPLGTMLRDLASAAIDVSDGLVADLTHLSQAGGVGATVKLDNIPLSPQARQYYQDTGDWKTLITGGDDYELCFTLPVDKLGALTEQALALDCPVTCIGEIDDSGEVKFLGADGHPCDFGHGGFDHFSRS